jgi:CIC family chloride channel protein
MAALFTGIVRAPLTGVVLIIEMTGNYQQMLPLLVACFAAYAVAEYLRDIPIYEALLMRDLQRNGVTSRHAKPVVAEYTVESGSQYDGKLVRELGLPPGCILVRCQYEQQEVVPTADTILRANMRMTVVVPPHATHALATIREGCDPFNE